MSHSLPEPSECRCASLIPRPSHHPVFDRLKYAKMEGERPGMNDVSVYEGGKGSLLGRTHFTHALFVLNQEQYIFQIANV